MSRGDVQRDRAAARAGRGPERLAHHLRDPLRLRHRPRLLRDRREQRLLVDLLERVPVDVRGRQRARDRDHRRVRGVRLREAGHQVRRARPVLAGEHHARPARRPRVAVGHVRAGALVAHADEADPRRRVQRVEDLHARRADQPEHVLHALRLERVHHRLSARAFRHAVLAQIR
jgi:hypothetical protein